MESTLIITDGLSPALGFAVIGALGLAMLALALAVRSMIRTTDDYVAAGRRIGLGFSVGSVVHSQSPSRMQGGRDLSPCRLAS